MTFFFLKKGLNSIGSIDAEYTLRPITWSGSGYSGPKRLSPGSLVSDSVNLKCSWLVSSWLAKHLLLHDKRLPYGEDQLVWDISDIQWLPNLSR